MTSSTTVSLDTLDDADDETFVAALADIYEHSPWVAEAVAAARPFGTLAGLLLLVGTAMVSRIAKTFQDYTVNVIIQKFGARIYTDGLRHALRLPYAEFEDQRSGETLSVLQKVRTDTERFISVFVNVLFATIVGIVFVIAYALTLNSWLVVIYLGVRVSFCLSRRLLSALK